MADAIAAFFLPGRSLRGHWVGGRFCLIRIDVARYTRDGLVQRLINIRPSPDRVGRGLTRALLEGGGGAFERPPQVFRG